MRGVGRSLLLTLFLSVAVVSLVVLVAALQAPVPGGGSEGSSDARGTGAGFGDTRGAGASQGENVNEEGRPRRANPCPPDEEGGSATPAASMLVLAPVPLGRSRRMRALGLLGLAAVMAGCSYDDECRPVQVREGGGGGGGGTGGGLGTGDGPGTGTGTEPDPIRFDPKALWIVLLVLGVILLVALLVSALGARRGKKGRHDPDAADADDEATLAEAGASSREPRDVLAGMPEGNARAVVAAYVEACATLAGRGVWRRSHETARELAQRAPDGCRDAMARLTGLYEAARHGGVQPSDEAVRQARELGQAVARASLAPEVVKAG